MTLLDIARILTKNNEFMLISHTAPDGDTLGSALALRWALLSLGKNAIALCDCEDVPKHLRILPGIEAVNTTPIIPKEGTVAIAVDCADIQRMNKMANVFAMCSTRVMIDHHISNEGFGDVFCVRKDACATGEIMFDLIELLGVPMDVNIAICLYAAVATDTGNFTNSNTTPKAFSIAQSALIAGLPLWQTSHALFRIKSIERVRLIALAIDNVRLLQNGAVALSVVTQEEAKQKSANLTDSESVIDVLRDIDGVEVAVLARETAENEFRVSFRSCKVDVAEIAARYGGGGHVRASGCEMRMGADELAQEILTALGVNEG